MKSANRFQERPMIRAMRSSALSLLLAFAVTGVPAHGQDPAPAPPASQRVTLAQIFVTRDVGQNPEHIRAAFAQAERERAQWVFFPEGALSGYYDGFKQDELAPAFAEVKELCRKPNCAPCSAPAGRRRARRSTKSASWTAAMNRSAATPSTA